MQNTKIEYGSGQRTPVVLPEIEKLLPPLSAEQFSALDGDILENGCYAPIIVNEEKVIIDGHNQFRICEKHGLRVFASLYRRMNHWRPDSHASLVRRVKCSVRQSPIRGQGLSFSVW